MLTVLLALEVFLWRHQKHFFFKLCLCLHYHYYLAILFRLCYSPFIYFGFERSWWWLFQIKVGISKTKVGITNIKVDITKNKVGNTNIRVGFTKNKVGITNIKVGITKNKVEITNIKVGITKNKVGITNIKVGITKNNVGNTNIIVYILKPKKRGEMALKPFRTLWSSPYKAQTQCYQNNSSGSLRFSQFSGCWLILSVYIIMSFDFPFIRLFGVR